jgi:hypothetical protein
VIIVEKLSPPTFKAFVDRVRGSSDDVLHFDGHGVIARQCPRCKSMNYPHHDICQAVIDEKECGYNLKKVPASGYLAFEKITIITKLIG